VNADPRHEDCWQQLPWLANGRLPVSERAAVEEHLRTCSACTEELRVQRLLCTTLAAPERVTYAPGPSFRKLLERIDGTPARVARAPARRRTDSAHSAWRPPGLAWAASVLVALGAAMLWSWGERWGEPRYLTHTSGAPVTPGVLHIAFAPGLSVADATALLRTAGARVVEGPDPSGVFGVRPAVDAPQEAAAAAVDVRLRALAAHLRGDARVRWIEPLPEHTTPPPPTAP
jgi:Putative zinc-finger